MEDCNISELYEILMVAEDKVDIWRRIFNSVIQNERNFNELERIKLFVNFMAQKLLLYPCKDSQSVLRVLHMHQRQRWIEVSDCDERAIMYILEPLHTSNFVTNNYLCDWKMFLHAHEMSSYDLNILKLFVKYGIIREEERSEVIKVIKFKYRFGLEFIQFTSLMRLMFHRDVTRRNFSCSSAANTVHTIVLTDGKIGKISSERICMIVRFLYIIILKRLDVSDACSTLISNRIQCLKFYFTAFNEPFISQDEIKDFLQFLFASQDTWEDVVEQIVNDYREVFHDQRTLVYEPRTLKHQSRCAVRKQFSHQDASLPYLVDQLNVPRVIKEFLLGEPEFRS